MLILIMNPDVVLLEKTHAKRSVQMVLRANWLGQVYQANFRAKARGIAILFRKNIILRDVPIRFLLPRS